MRKGNLRAGEPFKTVYYSDPVNDDFALTHDHISKREIDCDVEYSNRGVLWNTASFVVYRLVATPLAYVICKVGFGLRIKGRRNIKVLRGHDKCGYLIFGNHTHFVDAFIPTFLSFPRKASIVTSPDAVSVPLLHNVVEMLGAVPIASGLGGVRQLVGVMKKKVRTQTLTVFPEAHLWPYYNGIRPFPANAFSFPYLLDSPVVAYVTTYRKRRVLSNVLPPAITVTVSTPFYPSDYSNKHEMRDAVYAYMCDVVEKEGSFAYIKYEQRAASPLNEGDD